MSDEKQLPQAWIKCVQRHIRPLGHRAGILYDIDDMDRRGNRRGA